MSARLPGYYIFKSVSPCLISLFAQFDRRLFFSSLEINTGFYLPKSKAFNISFPRRFIEPDFRRSLSFSMQSRLIPGSLFGLRHGESSLFTLFFSSLFSFPLSKEILIIGGKKFLLVCFFFWYDWKHSSLDVSVLPVHLRNEIVEFVLKPETMCFYLWFDWMYTGFI